MRDTKHAITQVDGTGRENNLISGFLRISRNKSASKQGILISPKSPPQSNRMTHL